MEILVYETQGLITLSLSGEGGTASVSTRSSLPDSPTLGVIIQRSSEAGMSLEQFMSTFEDLFQNMTFSLRFGHLPS
jgi:hypothetical protein